MSTVSDNVLGTRYKQEQRARKIAIIVVGIFFPPIIGLAWAIPVVLHMNKKDKKVLKK